MALPRFFVSLPSSHPPVEVGQVGSISCEKEVCHHIVNVLRLKVGDRIEIAQRELWTVWLCELETVSADDVRVSVLEQIPQSEEPFETTLVLGFSKGDTNEKVVRQATELGVKRIVPVLFERSISRPDEKRAKTKIERLRKVALSAAQQSHRLDVPVIEELQSFPAAIELISALQADLMLVPWEEERVTSLATVIKQEQLQKQIYMQHPDIPQVTESRYPHVLVVIGPEGGISADEIDTLRGIGARSVSLGSTILRVDTAAVAALAIVHDALRQ